MTLSWKFPQAREKSLHFLIHKNYWALVEAGWPHGQCAQLQIKWSGYVSWPGTLCCVLRPDIWLSECLSPPRCINGYRQAIMLGLTLQWTSTPSRRSRNTPSCFMLRKLGYDTAWWASWLIYRLYPLTEHSPHLIHSSQPFHSYHHPSESVFWWLLQGWTFHFLTDSANLKQKIIQEMSHL